MLYVKLTNTGCPLGGKPISEVELCDSVVGST